MKIFLTGSTGLLGGNILRRLEVENYQVKALVRDPEKASRINSEEIQIIKGDLKEVDSFASELNGCDLLIHAGACHTEFFKKGNADNRLIETNVKGTKKLLGEAYRRGIKNVIYISSAGVYDETTSKVIDENAPYAENTANPYFKSKIEAEKEVIKFIEEHPKVRVIIIQPALMMGPRDVAPTRMGDFILNIVKGHMKVILPVKTVVTDARDVAEAVVTAIEKGQSGAKYIIGGNIYEMKDIFKEIANALGKTIRQREISLKVAMLISSIMWTISKITGKNPPIPQKQELQRMNSLRGYSSKKAQKEFGIVFRPLSETIKDTVNWFTENKYL